MKAVVKMHNGFKAVKITRKGFQGFTIHTNGNLPGIHSLTLGSSFSLNEPSLMGREIRQHIKDFGTLNQCDLLGL